MKRRYEDIYEAVKDSIGYWARFVERRGGMDKDDAFQILSIWIWKQSGKFDWKRSPKTFFVEVLRRHAGWMLRCQFRKFRVWDRSMLRMGSESRKGAVVAEDLVPDRRPLPHDRIAWDSLLDKVEGEIDGIVAWEIFFMLRRGEMRLPEVAKRLGWKVSKIEEVIRKEIRPIFSRLIGGAKGI